MFALGDRLAIRGDRAAEEHAVGVGEADEDGERVAHTVDLVAATVRGGWCRVGGGGYPKAPAALCPGRPCSGYRMEVRVGVMWGVCEAMPRQTFIEKMASGPVSKLVFDMTR